MKATYPQYAQGELEEKEKGLSKKNKEILNKFAEFCSITAGEVKIGKIRRHIVQFCDVIGKDLDKITKDDVNSFLVVLNKSNRSVWTKNEIKVYVKKFLKWFYKDLDLIENIKGDSKRGLDYGKINENNLLTEEEVEKMLRFAENYKEKAFLFLTFESGARPQEIVNLRWQDVKFCDDYADITFYSGKTRQSRTFPVKKASKFLFEWKQNYSFSNVKNDDYIFPSRWREKHMTTVGLNKILKRISQKAGIERKVWNYLFRHTRATRLYEELPTPIVEKLMGHTNMAKIYAHISSKKAREEMLNKIYKIEGLPVETREELEKEIENLKRENRSQKESLVKLSDEDKKIWNLLNKISIMSKITYEAATHSKDVKEGLKKARKKIMSKGGITYPFEESTHN